MKYIMCRAACPGTAASLEKSLVYNNMHTRRRDRSPAAYIAQRDIAIRVLSELCSTRARSAVHRMVHAWSCHLQIYPSCQRIFHAAFALEMPREITRARASMRRGSSADYKLVLARPCQHAALR